MTREKEFEILRVFTHEGSLVFELMPICKRCGQTNKTFGAKDSGYLLRFTITEMEEFWQKYRPICFTCAKMELLLPSED